MLSNQHYLVLRTMKIDDQIVSQSYKLNCPPVAVVFWRLIKAKNDDMHDLCYHKARALQEN